MDADARSLDDDEPAAIRGLGFASVALGALTGAVVALWLLL